MVTSLLGFRRGSFTSLHSWAFFPVWDGYFTPWLQKGQFYKSPLVSIFPCLGWLLHSLASEGAVLQVSTREHFWYIGRCNFPLGANFAQFACSPHFCCYFNKRNWKTQKMEQEKEQEEEEVKKRIRIKKSARRRRRICEQLPNYREIKVLGPCG